MSKAINIWESESREVMPGFHGRFVHSEKMTIACWEIEANASLPEHQHHHEQVIHLLEGEFELTVDGSKMQMHPGDTVVLKSELPHAGRAITRCRVIDMFHPCREEFL
ncbi:MAG: cupin domain-containing protein [Planctomycetota bacterium]|nr:cupin domain-containing protein [Planctomycetota bacterium]